MDFLKLYCESDLRYNYEVIHEFFGREVSFRKEVSEFSPYVRSVNVITYFKRDGRSDLWYIASITRNSASLTGKVRKVGKDEYLIVLAVFPAHLSKFLLVKNPYFVGKIRFGFNYRKWGVRESSEARFLPKGEALAALL